MATYRGTDGVVRLGSNTILEVQSFSVSGTATPINDNVMGDEWDTHLVGRKNWTASVACLTDPADSTGQRAMTIGATAAFEGYPVGNSNGRIKLSGSATVTGKEYSNNHDNTAATVTFSLTGNGPLTEATV